MKNRLSLLLAAFALGSVWAQADVSFYFTNAALNPGGTACIDLCLRNTSADLTCLEAEIRLPEGLSVCLDDEGEASVTFYRHRTASHELLANVLPDGNLKILVSSADGALIKGTEGPLLTFNVKADESASTGEYQIETVGESLVVSSSAEAFYSVGATAAVLITDDPTGITEMAEGENDAAVYDLSGRRLSNRKLSNSKMPRGISIVGGRKELHK